MTKIIALNRKYLVMLTSVLLICLIGLAGYSFWQTKQTSGSSVTGTPEIQMLGVNVEPASVVKDLNYGNVTLKGAQVITSKTFDLIVTVQNTTAKKMTNIPVELQVSLAGDETKKVISPGVLPSLEPGTKARVAFRQIKCLGDALGKNATAGQHMMIVRIKPNPAGGVDQATEASFRFIVDSTVKAPAATNKQ
ncbi:hypothetical protein ACPUYX_12085 [Desulfosporosinus sp. SYSU MS00001]|uniref:hypothetical protein n=1 Tax=Desulfosporosinus sp. SYSU MS00001 TaxID=3416284 RepID=UPI003CEDC10F